MMIGENNSYMTTFGDLRGGEVFSLGRPDEPDFIRLNYVQENSGSYAAATIKNGCLTVFESHTEVRVFPSARIVF